MSKCTSAYFLKGWCWHWDLLPQLACQPLSCFYHPKAKYSPRPSTDLVLVPPRQRGRTLVVLLQTTWLCLLASFFFFLFSFANEWRIITVGMLCLKWLCRPCFQHPSCDAWFSVVWVSVRRVFCFRFTVDRYKITKLWHFLKSYYDQAIYCLLSHTKSVHFLNKLKFT